MFGAAFHLYNVVVGSIENLANSVYNCLVGTAAFDRSERRLHQPAQRSGDSVGLGSSPAAPILPSVRAMPYFLNRLGFAFHFRASGVGKLVDAAAFLRFRHNQS